ncbi:MAG TPA: class I SAM-dependent RNA methyltransferase [Aliidongia sp.]|uniref:class I SAM-dependent RNA methyltransferase n=1 Tax=Aliidongia sp. TaxID=1914230 RepID=UPI002DDDB060|nr:class I SAM-dependent RNA methyltransferase [Aliidongia sp.]HEV2677261.1 class I SAM-dependent RNA methyltransferase [Aliidongia sp.]
MRGRSRPPARRPARIEVREIELTIDKLGSEGVGVARVDGKPVLVPGALPGERIRARLAGGSAEITEVLEPSPDRVAPPCRHFGTCGGCALQHLGWRTYLDFKRDLVVEALRRQGLGEAPVAAIASSPPGTRRRAVFEAKRAGGTVVLGFHGRASHQIVDLGECPVLLPVLADLLPALRDLLKILLPGAGGATVQLAAGPGGAEVGLVLSAIPDLGQLERLALFAEAQDLARLWWRVGDTAPVPAAQRRSLGLRFGTVPVDPPSGGFLQATAAGEAALTAAVVEAMTGAERVADLFAGCGTFGLALGARAELHAVEGDAAALGALAAAARRAGLGFVTTERRDLESRPLLVTELKRFDAVLFDPPRAGAKAQALHLAQSTVPVVVGVSCNPATFARDARILVDGGYRLESVLPVDQFVWSPHVELVGRFARP